MGKQILTEFKINDIYNVNCLEMLQGMEDNSVDSLITDPPYGMNKDKPEQMAEIIRQWANGNDGATQLGKGFMGKEWDAFVPPPLIWKEIYRVLKPGAYGLVFASTRTQDLMSISMRFAGFQIKDVVEWLYMSGFPKSHNISKAIDKKAGAEREVIGRNPNSRENSDKTNTLYESGTVGKTDFITKATTPEAQKWEGWGTQLKPSHEPIILIQKPISEKTIADNVLKWGTGGLNIDETRIGETGARSNGGGGKETGIYGKYGTTKRINYDTGRFPANAITEDSDEFYSKYFNITPKEISKKAGKKDRNSDYLGNEIDLEEKMTGYSGGANNALDKGEEYREGQGIGLNRIIPKKNNHPTVKSIPLMEHLIKMITPPEGTVLDPFLGSGTTIVAVRRLTHEHPTYSHLNFIGSELSHEYFDICQARIFPEIKNYEDQDGGIAQ